jgi:hypothetical protein
MIEPHEKLEIGMFITAQPYPYQGHWPFCQGVYLGDNDDKTINVLMYDVRLDKYSTAVCRSDEQRSQATERWYGAPDWVKEWRAKNTLPIVKVQVEEE